MAKVMLVEDDNNLREIYEARLSAEGYDIVAAQDGEEALALAVKERPDLIIADIMMPKVSGFDMLDILRQTPETKHTKIIMMTALSQAEDKTRAEKLGADRYLVKSQVTLEDVVKVASEMLNADSGGASTPPITTTPTPTNDSPAGDPASNLPTVTLPEPATPAPAAPPADDKSADDTAATTTPADEPAKKDTKDTKTDKPKEEPAAPPVEKPSEPVSVAVEPAPEVESEPAAEPEPKPEPKPEEPTSKAEKLSDTTAKEEAEVSSKIEEFIAGNPTLTTSAEPDKEKGTVPAPTHPDNIDFKEEVITSAPVPAAKATAIPVTLADDEPAKPSPAKDDKTSEADQTMAKAVDNLISKEQPEEPAKPAEEPTSAPEVAGDKPSDSDDKPKPAKKGGERIIQPLSDPTKPPDPDLETLLAREESDSGIAPPPANAVIAPGGNITHPQNIDPAVAAQPAFSDGNVTPGSVVQAPSTDPEAPATPNPDHISI